MGTGNLMVFLKVVGTSVFFMVAGPSLILLNKYILYDLNFPFPFILAGMGVLTSALYADILAYSGYFEMTSEKKEAIKGENFVKRVLPVAIAYAATLALGNHVYLLLDVGFIQVR
jgi:hypothetical protein